MSDYQNMIDNCVRFTLRAHNHGYQVLPQIEAVTASIILNRFDWLETMGVTMASAIEIVPGQWLAVLGAVERIVAEYIALTPRRRPHIRGVK